MYLPIVRRRKGRSMMDPLQQRLSLLEDFQKQLFDEDVWRPLNAMSDEMERSMGYWMPKTDIAETDTEVTITANIPGVKPDDINIEVDDHSLIISGKTEEKKEKKGKTWYRVERESGELYRRFGLPDTVDTEKIEARTQNGVLTVTLKKKPSAARKQIKVEQG